MAMGVDIVHRHGAGMGRSGCEVGFTCCGATGW